MAPVLLISYSGVLGGAERILLDLARGLGEDAVVACPAGPLAQAARADSLTVLTLPERTLLVRGSPRRRLTAVGQLIGHGRSARRVIANVDPGVTVAWGMRSALALLLGPRPDVPVVFQHNDLLPSELIARLVRTAAARATLVVSLSRTIAADLDPRGRLGERGHVVHPGVDVSRWSALGPPADPSQVLVLGMLVGWKHPELALEAVAIARRLLPALHLRIVGEPLGPEGEVLRERLRRRADEPDLAGAVTLVGGVADPRSEFTRAACLLHCAPREPFGLVVVESLAAGRPAVVPDGAGPAEIVDAGCGRRYRPGDAGAAAEALIEVLGRPAVAAQLGSAGRERVAERFSLPAQSARWAQHVRGVARPDPPAARARAGDLTLVTVTHNSAPELGRMLRSLTRHLPGASLIVVDSGSADDSVAVAAATGGTTVLSLEANVGFGAACNAGLGRVGTPITALINPDVELLDDSLLRLVAAALGENGGGRVFAPLVLNSDGSRQDNVHPAPTSAADMVRSIIPPSALPPRLAARLAPWRSPAARKVGWATGCALVARTSTLRRLGPFDEDIFLYGEDLELGLRAAAQGVETWFLPEGRLIHHRAHASARAYGGEPYELLARTRDDAVRRALGERRARLDRAAQGLTFRSRRLLKRALGRPAERERRQLEALRSLRR